MKASSFVRSAALTYATNLIVAALSLVNVLIISRSLGPEGRGDFAFLVTVTLVSATVATLGIHQASANIAGREPSLRPSLATNALVFSVVNGGLAAAAIALLVVLFPAVGADVSPSLLALALASIPIQIIRSYLTYLVLADYGFVATNTAWLAGPVMNVIGNAALVLTGHLTVGTAMVVWIVGQALGVGILAVYVAVKLAGFGRPDVALAVRELRFGIKALPGNVMLIGNYRVNQWLTASISGARELGFYSVAVAWAEGLFFLPTALAAVQRPDVIRASAREASSQAAAVFRAATLLTIPLALALFVAAPFLCGTIFGPEFAEATDDLRWLIPGAFGVVALKLLGSALTAQGRPGLESSAISVSFFATLGFDVFLIPRYGGEGAAIASSAANCLGGGVVCGIFVAALGGKLGDLVPRPRDVADLYRGFRLLARKAALRGTAVSGSDVK